MGEWIGETIGGYLIEEELGRGGMATVYRGRHAAMDRSAAVKILAPHLLTEPDVVDRFLREARIIAQLNHPNIIQVYGTMEADGVHAYAMELLEGETLQERLAREERLSVDTALHITAQICLGLHTAHEAGLVHRDLKPANVAFGEDDTVKLMDFGTALDLDAARPGRTTLGIGTPVYAAPEQTGGGTVTRQADIYSIGVVLYEMLTGCPPFIDADPLLVAQQHQFEEPACPCTVREDIPIPVEEIVLKLLAKRPADRYPTCAAVLSDLSAVREGAPERSSARGVRTTGAAAMREAAAQTPPPVQVAPQSAAEALDRLADMCYASLHTRAARRRVRLALRTGGRLLGSHSRRSGSFVVLTVPSVGEVPLPATAVHDEGTTVRDLDEAALWTRSRSAAEGFYEKWARARGSTGQPEWNAFLDAAEGALPEPAPVPYRAELAAVAAAADSLRQAHRNAAEQDGEVSADLSGARAGYRQAVTALLAAARPERPEPAALDLLDASDPGDADAL